MGFKFKLSFLKLNFSNQNVKFRIHRTPFEAQIVPNEGKIQMANLVNNYLVRALQVIFSLRDDAPNSRKMKFHGL